MPEEIVKEKQLYRRFGTQTLKMRKEGDAYALNFPASSETPVERWYGEEVLVHTTKAVRLGRAKNGAMPLLFNHDMDYPIGMVTGAKIEDGRMMVDAKLFGTPRAEEIRSMIDGGLRNVSVAYRVNVIEEEQKTGNMRVTDWEPYEVSIVTVPADPTVGIGRGADTEYDVRMIRTSHSARGAATGEGRMDPEKEGNTAVAESTGEKPTKVSTDVIEAQRRTNSVELEKRRKQSIENLCNVNSLDSKYRDMWIGQGLSVDDVSDEILRVLEERGKTNPQPASKLGLTPKQVEQFSLARAIRACADKDWKDAQFELECSREVAKRTNRAPDPLKFLVPFEVLQRQVAIQPIQRGMGRRDLTVGTVGDGGYLVGTENMGFIEILRNRSVAFSMGVRRLSGLSGNVTVPRQTGAASPIWLANEASTATESKQAFTQMALTPKTVAAYTEISRLLLLQSSPSVEGIVTDDLAAVVAIAADLSVLNGSGAAGQPTGIIQTAGIGSVTGTSIDYAKTLEFQTDIAASNVKPVSGGYVTTPLVAAIMMGRVKFANTATPLWDGNIWDGTVCGFPGMSSNQMPSGALLFGDWQEVVVGEWGVLEVEVNPYANFQAGIIGVRAMYSLDVGVRRPFAFSYSSSTT